MRIKLFSVGLVCFFFLAGCQAKTPSPSDQGQTSEGQSNHNSTSNSLESATGNPVNKPENSEINPTGTSSNQPKTVREFFTLLPDKYFLLEGCEPAKDKNCVKARAEYLKSFLEIEDNTNGYMKGGCDGGQSCFVLALFKRPNGTYLVALNTEFEDGTENYFLDYSDGKWTDVSAEAVPQFSKKNFYELPQKGTTIQVFAKKFNDNYEDGKGAKLYDLEWKDGKFTVKR